MATRRRELEPFSTFQRAPTTRRPGSKHSLGTQLVPPLNVTPAHMACSVDGHSPALRRRRQRRTPSTPRTKTRGGVSETSITPKPILRHDRSMLSPSAWRVIANSLRISDRELQIIQEIFDDRKELAIADDLTISVHTVHTHLERLYRKLGVSTRAGLILYILSEYLSSLRSTL